MKNSSLTTFILSLTLITLTTNTYALPSEETALTICADASGKLVVKQLCTETETPLSLALLSASLAVTSDSTTSSKGERGDVGPQGKTGERGIKGDRGPVGPKGERGLRGKQGPRGPAVPMKAAEPPITSSVGSLLPDSITYTGAPFSIKAGEQATTVDVEARSEASTVARFGRSAGGAFQSLVEIGTQQTLTGFSGTQLGRGVIRLNDTIEGLPLELGYYRYGAGLFHQGLFEFFTNGLSVRQLKGNSPSYVGVRDASDVKQIKLHHNGNDGVLSTDDQPADSNMAGSISIRPNSKETWVFNQRSGDLTENSHYGGNIVFKNGRKTVLETVDDAVSAQGNSQADAYELKRTHSTVVTISSDDTGVRLPPIGANSVGSHVDIFNAHRSLSVTVYPAVDQQINALGKNTSIQVPPQKFYWCRATAPLQWRCGLSG